MPVKGDPATVRALNRRLLLRLLRENGPVSRSELAERSGLSNGAVTRIVGDLIEQGFLVERSMGASTGGRPPVLLDLDTTRRVVAGLKLMDDAVLTVLVDMKGAVLGHSRTVLRSHEPRSVLDRAATAVNTLLRRAAVGRDRLAGAGMCLPGAVDWQSGICRVSPFFGWHDVHAADLLADRLGAPVVIDNDVNALAVAESLFGQGRRLRDFAVVTLGRGVGAGLVCGGAVYRGSSGAAGEFGHQVSEIGGRPCECGKRGCLEAYVSENAVLARMRSVDGSPATDSGDTAEFLRRARGGDAAATALYADVVARLGAALANLVNLLNPQLVLLAGEAGFLDQRFVADLRPHVASNVFAGSAGGVDLRLDETRTEPVTWSRGAASLAVEHLFDPLIQSQGVASA